MMALDGGTLSSNNIRECEIVIVRSDHPIIGATMFKFCNFNRCNFFRITFMLNHRSYENLPDDFRRGVPVISDGRIGDV